MFPSVFGTPVKQEINPVEEPKENKTLAVYQKQQEKIGWLTQSWNFITTQWQEYWTPTPVSSTTSIFSNSKRIDPTDFCNACQVLGLSENDAKNLELVHTRFGTIMNSLKQRKSKLSEPLASQIQLLMNDVQTAYNTLTNTPTKGVSNELDTTTQFIHTPLA